MRIGCSTWSFHEAFDAREIDLLSWFDLAAEMRLEAVELLTSHFPSVSPRFMRELNEKRRERPVEISAISVSNNFGHPDAVERARQCDDVVGWMHVAKSLGVGILRTFTGHILDGVNLADAKRWVWESYGKIVPIAVRLGVTLAIENHGNLMSTAEELEALLWHFGSSSLQFNPDPTNFLPRHAELPEAQRGPIYDSLERLARFTVHSHLKIGEFDATGAPTNVDVPRLLAIYRKACFDGVISFERFGNGDPRGVIEKGVKYLRSRL